MTLLFGLIIVESTKNINWKTTKTWIPFTLIALGVFLQIVVIPQHLSAMQNYNNMLAPGQKTYYETVEATKMIIPNETIYYLPQELRNKYGYQFDYIVAQRYVCLIGRCDLKVTTNYSETNIIMLPSSLDIYTFQKEFPNEKPQILKIIKNGNEQGALLKK
jgi:hypothetical protein